MSPTAKAYKVLPVTLHRMTMGGRIKIRKLAADLSNDKNYDIVAEGNPEKVKPKSQPELQNYQGPNGVSMRPLNPRQVQLVGDFNGNNVVVASIPKNTPVPEKLIVIHEWTRGVDSHYSLQPEEEMTLSEFHARVQAFLDRDSLALTRTQWLLQHRAPVHTTGPNKEPLKWGPDYKKWYYTDSKTKKHVLVECKDDKK